MPTTTRDQETATVTCLVCEGTGTLRYPPATHNSEVGGKLVCDWCHGSGRMKYHPMPIVWAKEKEKVEEQRRRGS